MTWRHPTEQDWDRQRDYRKHEPRPGDKDFVPLHVQAPPIATALEVAILVKGLKDIREAEKLVEQYAQTVAAAARLDGVTQAYHRIDTILGGGQ